jgi:hypothetical protein
MNQLAATMRKVNELEMLIDMHTTRLSFQVSGMALVDLAHVVIQFFSAASRLTLMWVDIEASAIAVRALTILAPLPRKSMNTGEDVPRRGWTRMNTSCSPSV